MRFSSPVPGPTRVADVPVVRSVADFLFGADYPAPWQAPSAPPETAGGSRRAVSVLVWGPDREALNLLTYAFARALDPSPFWLEIRLPPGDEAAGGHVRHGWVRPPQLHIADSPPAIRLRPRADLASLRRLVRSDPGGLSWLALDELLRLPDIVQDVVGDARESASARVLVAANTDLAVELYPQSPGEASPLLRALEAAGVTVLASHVGDPPEARHAFATVVRLDLDSIEDWPSGLLEREPSGLPGGPPPDRVPLLRLPEVADVFRARDAAIG